MDFDKDTDFDHGRNALEFLDGVPAPKSSLRMRYEAETKVFRSQFGGLEDIRQKLGFSRRKMCQLLLVDPSAWTRWMRDETKVPPHVYRSLEWFLALNERSLTHPELSAVFAARYKVPTQVPRDDHDWSAELAEVQRELARQRRVSYWLSAALIIFGVLFSLKIWF